MLPVCCTSPLLNPQRWTVRGGISDPPSAAIEGVRVGFYLDGNLIGEVVTNQHGSAVIELNDKTTAGKRPTYSVHLFSSSGAKWVPRR